MWEGEGSMGAALFPQVKKISGPLTRATFVLSLAFLHFALVWSC